MHVWSLPSAVLHWNHSVFFYTNPACFYLDPTFHPLPPCPEITEVFWPCHLALHGDFWVLLELGETNPYKVGWRRALCPTYTALWGSWDVQCRALEFLPFVWRKSWLRWVRRMWADVPLVGSNSAECHHSSCSMSSPVQLQWTTPSTPSSAMLDLEQGRSHSPAPWVWWSTAEGVTEVGLWGLIWEIFCHGFRASLAVYSYPRTMEVLEGEQKHMEKIVFHSSPFFLGQNFVGWFQETFLVYTHVICINRLLFHMSTVFLWQTEMLQ